MSDLYKLKTGTAETTDLLCAIATANANAVEGVWLGIICDGEAANIMALRGARS